MQTILVCDDDKEIVEAIQIYLEQEGMRYSRLMTGCRLCSRSGRIILICW